MSHSIEFTQRGYLLLDAEVAQRFFPEDSLVALVRDGEIWLLPTRGPAGGGLMLKQRNLAGDRSVLIHEILPHVPVGRHQAIWDAERGALCVRMEIADA